MLVMEVIIYPIEPQVKPAKRYPLSDIERAVGDPKPWVSSLVGSIDSLLLNLNKPLGVEK
jgi:hypothetical protein